MQIVRGVWVTYEKLGFSANCHGSISRSKLASVILGSAANSNCF